MKNEERLNRPLYFEYLLKDQMHFSERIIKRWSKMWTKLYYKEYEPLHPMDTNRIRDAERLRAKFCSEYDFNPEFPPSIGILEVYCALAIRVDLEYIGDPKNPDPGAFLWDMLDIWGLIKLDNSHFSDVIFEKKTDKKTAFCHFFEKMGQEGCVHDQELWSKTMTYLSLLCQK